MFTLSPSPTITSVSLLQPSSKEVLSTHLPRWPLSAGLPDPASPPPSTPPHKDYSEKDWITVAVIIETLVVVIVGSVVACLVYKYCPNKFHNISRSFRKLVEDSAENENEVEPAETCSMEETGQGTQALVY